MFRHRHSRRIAIFIALALSAVGIGLERVAWIASALSVSIGFGLQAVVQNFLSGMILLASRAIFCRSTCAPLKFKWAIVRR